MPFAGAFAAISVAVNHSTVVEQQVHSAQIKRTVVLRLQLDEETGLRGYVATKNRAFLQPYMAAEKSFAGAVADLRSAVAVAASQVIPFVDDQKITHRRWIEEIAKPLIVNPSRDAAPALQVEGKRLVDRFRDDNDATLRALDAAAQRSDDFAHRTVYGIIALGFVLGMALLILMLQIGARHQHLQEKFHVQNALHDRERQIADALQDALMPYDVPSVPGLRLHARYRPADEPDRVGGDWYDALPTPDGRILIIVGDVTGHGITAIELMSRLRRKIIAAALHQHDPGEILREANRQALRTFSREPLLGTAVCAFVDPRSREIVYATAGHPGPLLVQPDGTAEFLHAGDLMLGIEDCSYQTNVARAARNALLVFYTDGLTEFSRDPIDGERRLLQAAGVVAASRIENPAVAIGERVLGGAAPHDDIAIFTVVFGSVEGESLLGQLTRARSERIARGGLAAARDADGPETAKVAEPAA